MAPARRFVRGSEILLAPLLRSEMWLVTGNAGQRSKLECLRGVDEQRDGAVVDKRYLHLRAKFTRSDSDP